MTYDDDDDILKEEEKQALEYEPLRFVWQDKTLQQNTKAVVVAVTKNSGEKEMVQEHLQESDRTLPRTPDSALEFGSFPAR